MPPVCGPCRGSPGILTRVSKGANGPGEGVGSPGSPPPASGPGLWLPGPKARACVHACRPVQTAHPLVREPWFLLCVEDVVRGSDVGGRESLRILDGGAAHSPHRVFLYQAQVPRAGGVGGRPSDKTAGKYAPREGRSNQIKLLIKVEFSCTDSQRKGRVTAL